MIYLDGNSLTLEDFIRVARFYEEVSLTDEAVERVKKSRKIIDELIDSQQIVYGINTGFGKLANVVIENEQLSQLQENLLKSHACGVGDYLNEEMVRGMMVLRVNALAKGCSGIRIETIELLIELLNKRITPAVPEQGSLGASGDLAPLSHMALPLIGLGEVFYQGKLLNVKEAFEQAKVTPLSHLEAKEGLSLINGTQAMTSVGAITTYDAIMCSKTLDIAASLTMEALRGITDAYDARIHEVRGHVGQIETAKTVLCLLEGSEYTTKGGELRVQDAYSLRCIPQVHGATKDALKYIKEKIEIEMNAATDNPLIFASDAILSGGNFHGQPMALIFDYLKIAIAEMANISERRIERLVNPQLNENLPAFLVAKSGVNSGFMIMQYTAASLVSENKVLSHPASVDSIPSSANQEDHVSMGTIAARGARDILENVLNVVAIECLAATQALDLREKKTLGMGTQVAYDVIRREIPFIDGDVIMYPYIRQMRELIKEELLLEEIKKRTNIRL